MVTTKGPMFASIGGALGKSYAYIPTGKDILPQVSPILLMAGKVGNGGEAEKYLGGIRDNQGDGMAILESKNVTQAEFSYTEFNPERTREYTLDGALTTASTSMKLDEDVSDARPGDLFYLAGTGEIVRVNGDINLVTKTIPIERAFSSTGVVDVHEAAETLTQDSATAPADNSKVIRLGPADEEGSFAKYRNRKIATRRKGHTQILRSDLIQTGTNMAQEETHLIKEETFGEYKIQELANIFADHEYIAFFGKLHRASRNGEIIRTTKGVYNSIVTNVVASTALQGGGTAYSIDKQDDIIYRATKRVPAGVKEKPILLVGWQLFNNIKKVNATETGYSINLEPGANTYGLALEKIIAPFGPDGIKYLYYPLLDTLGLSDEIVQINPAFLQLVTLNGRNLDWKDETQQPDFDGKAGRWLCEFGVIPLHEQMHARYTGFTV